MEGKNATQIVKLQAVYTACISLIGSLPSRMRSNRLILELFNTVVVRFGILVITFAATTLITRALSVEDRGKYAILLNLINCFVTFLTFGFHTSIIYRLSNNWKLFSSLYVISLFISISSIFIILLFCLFGGSTYYFPEFNDFDNFLLISGCPIVLFSYFSSFFFLGINNFQQYNFFEFIKSFIFLALVLLFFFSKINYQDYISLFVFSSLVHSIGSFFFFFKNKYIQKNKLNIKNNFLKYYCVLKQSVSYSMMSYFSCNLALLLSRYNLFFIGGFLNVEDPTKSTIGYYSVALNNIDIISILPTTLAFFIFPKISAVADLKMKVKITNQMIIVCLLFFAVIGILSFTILDYLFEFLYGPIYQEAVPMFQLLLPSALFLSIIACISSFIGGIGTQRTMIYAPLTGLIFMILSSLGLLYINLNVYYFICAQNISYFLYLVVYYNFFIKKWREI
jgi:O-antigen/teichoic acid export membrane protein